MSAAEQRRLRLKNDYREMCNIRGNIIAWRELEGTAPEITKYELKVKIRSIIDSDANYRVDHVIRVELPPGYPTRNAPHVVMTTKPIIYHPNWYEDGRWCEGTWVKSDGLGEFVIRMLRTVQFDPEITNEGSPANPSAKDWYVKRKNSKIFPCDSQVLPDPTKSGFVLKTGGEKTFKINNAFSINRNG